MSVTETEKQGPQRTAKWLARRGITVCTECGVEKPTEDCVAISKHFQMIGKHRKTLKAITIAKVCSECLAKDPDWNSEPRWQ